MVKNPATKKTPKKKKTSNILKYSGELAKPIVETPPLGLLGYEDYVLDYAHRRAAQKQIAKLPELFRHFEIDPTEKHRWSKLAIALASKHVPGMRVTFNAKKSGRRPKWKAGQYAELLSDAEKVRQTDPAMTHKAVIERLLQTDRWGGKGKWEGKGHTPENLTARYREARRMKEERQSAETLLGPEHDLVLKAFGPVPPSLDDPSFPPPTD
jgi:hypothetical protein